MILLVLGLVVFDPISLHAVTTVQTTSKTCDEAKQLAITGITGGSQVGMGVNVVDKCIAAVLDETKMQGKADLAELKNPKNYKCVGKVVKISTDATGKVTEEWETAEAVPVGVCVTKYCDAKGVCQPAKPLIEVPTAYPGYGEGEALPTDTSQNYMTASKDPNLVIPLNYPEGTGFDESGNPSTNALAPNSTFSGKELNPDALFNTGWPWIQGNGEPAPPLPPEYQPASPYQAWTGSRMDVTRDGVTYSEPYQPPLITQYDPVPSYNTPNPYLSDTTFGNDGNLPTVATPECHFYVWHWCAW